jgi:hypothetical protein
MYQWDAGIARRACDDFAPNYIGALIGWYAAIAPGTLCSIPVRSGTPASLIVGQLWFTFTQVGRSTVFVSAFRPRRLRLAGFLFAVSPAVTPSLGRAFPAGGSSNHPPGGAEF